MSNVTLVKRAPRTARPNRKATLTAVDSVIDSKPKKIADLIGVNIKVKGGAKSSDLRVTRAADPETSIFDIELNRIVSAIPILKCDKHNPIDLGAGVKLHADNTLCEFSFPPSDDKVGMLDRMEDAFARIHEHLGSRYRLMPVAAYRYTEEEMLPSFGISPMEVGCNPSFCAYTASVRNPVPFPDTLRTGSFHIHLGNAEWQSKRDDRMLTFDSRHDTIKLMDLFVGLGSVILDKDVEGSRERRKLYGQAGSLRPTPWGVEYRPLSPGPLKSREMTELILDLTDHVISHLAARTEKDALALVDPEMVQKAINQCDRALAEELLTKVNLPVSLMARLGETYLDCSIKEGWSL